MDQELDHAGAAKRDSVAETYQQSVSKETHQTFMLDRNCSKSLILNTFHLKEDTTNEIKTNKATPADNTRNIELSALNNKRYQIYKEN